MTSHPYSQAASRTTLILLVLCSLMLGCESTRSHKSIVGPATVAMPNPSNEAEARFMGDIGSALNSRGWDPQPASKVANAGHRITFAIRPAASGFSSRIELQSTGGQTVASGTAETDRQPDAIGDVALVFDESLAAFQRSLARARVPLPE